MNVLRLRTGVLCIVLLATSTSVLAGVGRRSPADYDVFRGQTVVKVFGRAVVIGVLDERRKNEGVIDLFRLETDAPLNPLSAVYPNASVEYRGGEVVVMDAESQTFHTFSTPQAQFSTPRSPAGFTGTHFVGYGLNHTIRAMDSFTLTPKSGQRQVIGAADEGCGWDICPFDQDPYDTGGGGGGSSCTEGGRGAVQCSITTNSGACSVTCASGYYACCKDRFMNVPLCNCVSN